MTENAAEAQVTGGTGPFTFVWDDALGEATIAGLTIGSHELKVVDGLGCIKTLVFEVMTLGVDDLSTNYEIELFPNPAQDVLNLEIRGLDANTMNIQVIDISGTMIRSKKLKNNTEQNVHMDVSVLPQGYYLLSIQSKNIHITKKFFKM